MEKTLVVSDLDGTLLTSKAELSPFTTAALTDLIGRGMCFTVATARTPVSAMKLLGALPLRVPLVMMNGVLLYDPATGVNLHAELLDEQSVAEIRRALRSAGVSAFHYRVNERDLTVFHEPLHEPLSIAFHQQRLWMGHFREVPSLDDVPAGQTGYISMLGSYDMLLPVRDALAGHGEIGHVFYRDVYTEGLWFLELFSARVSKQTAVERVTALCGAGHVIAFGDNLNDIPLFRAGNECYAVANARDELKAMAHGVIGGNDEDGVARWLLDHWKTK